MAGKSGLDKSSPYIINNPMVLNRITLGQIVRPYKAKTTYQIRFCSSFVYFKWQRNYYEHTIRNEHELNHIREYVINNPSQWEFDMENTDRIHDKAYDDYWGSFEEAIYGKTKNNFRKIMLLQSPMLTSALSTTL